MKLIVLFLTILTLTSCSNSADKSKSNIDNKQTEMILGERINGPANMFDKINGKINFTLNDNVLVSTAPRQGKWQLIGLYVALTNKQFKIYPNSELTSTEGQVIGKTKDTVEIWMGDNNSGFIGAYTFVDNIKPQTIPEIGFENEIEKGNTTLKSLRNYLTNFNFKDSGENDELNYKEFYLYESGIDNLFVDPPPPRDRITLLFDKENNLIGAFHSRHLKIKNSKTYELTRGHSLTIIANLNKTEIKRIIKTRIDFYNSVD